MSSPFDFFDQIYCINLEHRFDRWKQCEKQFAEYELKNVHKVKGTIIKSSLSTIINSRLGYNLTYCETLDLAFNHNKTKILILEDDFEFSMGKEKLNVKLEKCLNELPSDWDCFYLGAAIGKFYGLDPIEKYSSNLFKLNCGHTTHAVAFSIKGIKKIYDILKSNQNWKHELLNRYYVLDVFLSKEYQKNTNSFISSEILCHQSSGFSNILNENTCYKDYINNNFNYYKNQILNE